MRKLRGSGSIIVGKTNLDELGIESTTEASAYQAKGVRKRLRKCRICTEEDEEHEMEAPCACNGTLKMKVFFFF
ncbi:hypothetical protein RHMOL_Rhmol05G0120800 [Rhododendron molle]|uniref:Uncharacterized protein n=3 Tax=Rhododendron molle TaxID=49168 RepID=A0ACC0NNB0_RHOML|nr:hypothetical protein RHMOL_Rhmol05G0120800 [Rhododendron molle]KAI8554729.1 hypothetical protein RHMOL_Rhmol05G0120800 [Rhododendron molle]KAI8554730.1 hypothetical protein RHMOL_Rhmol05G0120800 [Rhododendron molle]